MKRFPTRLYKPHNVSINWLSLDNDFAVSAFCISSPILLRCSAEGATGSWSNHSDQCSFILAGRPPVSGAHRQFSAPLTHVASPAVLIRTAASANWTPSRMFSEIHTGATLQSRCQTLETLKKRDVEELLLPTTGNNYGIRQDDYAFVSTFGSAVTS